MTNGTFRAIVGGEDCPGALNYTPNEGTDEDIITRIHSRSQEEWDYVMKATTLQFSRHGEKFLFLEKKRVENTKEELNKE